MSEAAAPGELSAFNRLLRFATTGPRRFALAIASSNHRHELREQMARAKGAGAAAGRTVATCEVADGAPVMAQLLAALGQAEVLFVTGLEELLLDRLGGPRFSSLIEQLNWDRDRLARELPAQVVLWMSCAAERAFAEAARDLSDVVMARYEFLVPVHATLTAAAESGLLPPMGEIHGADFGLLSALSNAHAADRDAELPNGKSREDLLRLRRVADRLAANQELDTAFSIWSGLLPALDSASSASGADVARWHVRQRAEVQSNMATVLAARGRLEEALALWRDQVLPVFEAQHDPWSRAATLSNIAEVLALLRRHDEALRIWMDEVLPASIDLRNGAMVIATSVRIAELLTFDSKVPEALQVLRRSVEEVEEIQMNSSPLFDPSPLLPALMSIAELQSAQGEHAQACRIWRQDVLPAAEQSGNTKLAAVVRQRLASESALV